MIYYIIMFAHVIILLSVHYINMSLYINTSPVINIDVYLYKSFCIFMHRYTMQHFLSLTLKYINILKCI